MEMMELRKSPNMGERRSFDKFSDKEIDEEEIERVSKQVKKEQARSDISCHFTDKANYLISKMAVGITNKVSEIVQDIKVLIQDLLLLPQAIIVCIPKEEELYEHATKSPVKLTMQNINNEDGHHVVIDTKESTRDQVRISYKNGVQNDIAHGRNTLKQEDTMVGTSKDRLSALKSDRQFDTKNNVNSVHNVAIDPEKIFGDALNIQHDISRHAGQNGNPLQGNHINPQNLPWKDAENMRQHKRISDNVQKRVDEMEEGRIIGLLRDILQDKYMKHDKKSI